LIQMDDFTPNRGDAFRNLVAFKVIPSVRDQ